MNAPFQNTCGPGVTLIVPNYNYGAYVGETLASIAAQTRPPAQTIVYDDGSDDGSLAAIEAAFASHSGRLGEAMLIAKPTNRGKLHALNTTIPLVEHEITVILDADDVIHPRFLEILVERLHEERSADPSVGFVYTDCELMDAQGTVIAPGNSEAFDAEKLTVSSYIPDCAPTVTTVLKAALPFDESIRVATKHHKWQRIVPTGVAGVHVPQRLFRYRMHKANISGIGVRIEADLVTGAGKEPMLSKYWQSAPASPSASGAQSASASSRAPVPAHEAAQEAAQEGE